MVTSLLGLLLFLLPLSLLLSSQTGRGTPAQGSTTEPSTPTPDVSAAKDTSPSDFHSTTPFDISVKALPPRFAGNDIAAIYDALKNIESGKGEFETTQQFRDRMNSERAKPIVGSLTYDSTFAFQVTPVQTHYDADRGILHAELDLSDVWKKELETDDSRLALTSLHVSDGGTDGVGSNAFGASRRITTTNYVQYEVAFKRTNMGSLARYRHSGLEQTISISISMGPDEASTVSLQTQALLICKLASPFVSEAEIYKTATLDDPTEMHSTEFYVHVAPLDLWLYEPSTGKVVVKLASH